MRAQREIFFTQGQIPGLFKAFQALQAQLSNSSLFKAFQALQARAGTLPHIVKYVHRNT